MDSTPKTFLARLSRNLGPDAAATEALRAIEVVPETLRAQGARATMWIGGVLLARGPDERTRAEAGLAHAARSIADLRDLFAPRRAGAAPDRHAPDRHAPDRHAPDRHPPDCHPVVRRVTAQVHAEVPGLLAELDRFVSRCVPPRDGADGAFDDVLALSFDAYLPMIDRMADAMDAAVAEARADAVRQADEARRKAQDARTRIGELTRTVRMISVNARIEAARAGEAGVTFKVIADEITGLATQVEAAADDVRTGIDGIVRSRHAD